MVMLSLSHVQSAKAQADENFWYTLAKIKYEKKTDEYGFEIQYPIFSKEVKQWEGKRIRLRGYIVPLEELRGQKYFMFSSLTFNVCFFCGGAGPETIVETFTANEITFTNDIITLEGTLELNQDDPDHHMYMMKDARLVK